MARQATSGKCRLCGHIFKGNNMSTHLRTCLKKSPLPGGKKAVTQKLYHVAVKGSYAPDYWMHLLVPTVHQARQTWTIFSATSGLSAAGT